MAELQTTVPPLTSLKVVTDPALPRDELRVHPAMFDLLQQAFMEAEMARRLWGGLAYGGTAHEPKDTKPHDN